MTDSRLGGLEGLLAPAARRPVPAPAQPVDVPSDPPALTRTPVEKRTRRGSATAATRPRVVTRLPQDLHDQLVQVAAAERLSYAAVLLRAVEKAYEDDVLEDLLAGQRETEGQGGLFSTVAPRPRPTAKVPTEFQPHHADLKKLDDLWKQLGAKDRTEFLTVALEHYFSAAS